MRFDEPHHISWRQEDENGVFRIDYRLEECAAGTRFRQHDEIDWKISPVAVEFGRRIVPRHIRQQFTRL